MVHFLSIHNNTLQLTQFLEDILSPECFIGSRQKHKNFIKLVNEALAFSSVICEINIFSVRLRLYSI